MNPNRINGLLGLFASISLFVSCAAKNSSPQSDPVPEAYRLIDLQRTDEAIDLLKSEIVKNPEDREARFALASAYAHKSGFKIQKFVGLLKSIEKIKEENPNKGHDKVNRVKDLGFLLGKASGVISVFSDIPEIEPEKIQFLKEAILQITFIENPTQTERLYRGILRVLLLKHYIIDNFIDLREMVDVKNCRFDIDNLKRALVQFSSELISTLEDYAAAVPDKSVDATALANKVSSSIENISNQLTDLSIVDEIGSLWFKEGVIAIGFGKLLTCP